MKPRIINVWFVSSAGSDPNDLITLYITVGTHKNASVAVGGDAAPYFVC